MLNTAGTISLIMSKYDHMRINLDVDEIPKKWYNIAADSPEPIPPPLNPGTKEPATAKDLEAIFPKGIIAQEVSTERYIDIPEEVRDVYVLLQRPSPLQRATRLEKMLKTPARIYFKREDLSPGGSHKPNSAIPQAYYNMKEGIENLTTETGAGQWGSALALACAFYNMKCTVFMVRVSYDQKPFRRYIMETYGAKVFASPSKETEYGRLLLGQDKDNPGSLGIAISEAIETCVKQKNTKYALGSVANHVMLHQTVIGQEVMAQLKKVEETPDYMIGCVGGGSNFAGFAFPMMGEKLRKKNNVEFIAAEPSSVPSITKGEYRYDFGDTAGMTPLFKMYTLGHEFIPSAIHAGGLRYHGMAPTVSKMVDLGLVKGVAYHQNEVFEAATMFAKSEGIIPAPESSHAIKAAIDLALQAKQKNEEKVIVFNLSGHGLLDMQGYASFIAGKMNGSM
ncbi:MAG: Tryptophan synthase beta chain 1 [Methanomassiliicoccales archaeon PtaU1.Bin124]|nr:MAG: Tryptophan synthase beta chain 1 [Methanomassiliicoccales archaeon PtaU1.Bin124]